MKLQHQLIEERNEDESQVAHTTVECTLEVYSYIRYLVEYQSTTFKCTVAVISYIVSSSDYVASSVEEEASEENLSVQS